jgi:hypothetical protein
VLAADRTGALGALKADGSWLLPPERGRSLRAMAGWLVWSSGADEDTAMNASGRTVRFQAQSRVHEAAPGTAWLQGESGWQWLDPGAGRVRTVPGTQGAGLAEVVEGHVVLQRPAAGAHELALFDARGRRLIDWAPLSRLEAIRQPGGGVAGWIGQRRDDEAGGYSILFSAAGKPLTPLRAMAVAPAAHGRAVFTTDRGRGLMTAQGRVLLPALYRGVEHAQHGWFKTGRTVFDGLIDDEGRWLAVEPETREFRALAHQAVARLGSDYDGHTAVDINGRRIGLVQVPEQPLAARELAPRRWQATPSPLPADRQAAVDDAQPANWFVHGRREQATVRDMLGSLRLKAPNDDAALFTARDALVQVDDGRSLLLDPQGRQLAAFDDATLRVHGDRLVLAREQPLPADHPLARPAARGERDGHAEALLREPARPAQAVQLGLVRERDGHVLAEPRFDALGEFREGRATVSLMGNLGLVDEQGQVVLRSAWRCGETAVLLDAQGEIAWPEALRGQAQAPCKSGDAR